MGKLSAIVKFPTFDKKAFSVSRKKILNALIRNAARAFIKEAIKHIPYKRSSGMSRGAYMSLSKFLKLSLDFPSYKRRERYRKTRQFKSPQLGAALSIQAPAAFSEQGNKFTFRFRTNIFHYNLNEFFGLRSNKGIPWRSIKKGEQALIKYLKKNVTKNMIKAIQKSLIKTTIQLDPKGGIRTKIVPATVVTDIPNPVL